MYWTTVCAFPSHLIFTLLTQSSQLSILLPLLATTAHSLRTHRITTKFGPSCPSKSQIPGDLDLDERFTVSMNIREGVCQGVPVPIPLGYLNEVDHVSFALEIDERQRGHGANLNSSSSPSIHPSANIHPSSSASVTPTTPTPTPTPTPSSISVAGFWRRKESRPNIEICTVRLFERPGCYEPVLIQREFSVGSGTGGESQCVQRSREYMPLAEVFVRIDCSTGSGSGYTHAPVTGNGTAHANATAKGHVSHPPNGVMPGRWQQRRLSLLGR